MKIYIYTVPKAGTYFLADLVARLGFENTGFHVSQNAFLNTRKFDLQTNAQFPGRAKENQFFVRTLRQQPPNSLSFGHLPVPLAKRAFPGFRFICSYRHPRKTLVSEFIDMRFRRKDIPWISPAEIRDDRQAFVEYLNRQGPAHERIFKQMYTVALLLADPFAVEYSPDEIALFNFESVLRSPEETVRISQAIGAPVSPERAAEILAETRAAETKTKATGLSIDRESLWSEEADRVYRAMDFEAVVDRFRALNLDI